ncbi:PAS domain S-box-containing protein [Maribacter vaceletii]|uniref:histidine kinase n=1 Tax=Maribacter vaceletii TaxID=1206816 RepID=A0A495EAV9_9FLAO|nr:PAS domain-containing protein [Maribacter vaceletii]RKR14044.1 PAS domain S-box-containing protein [Maribacter vaceletii]
MNNSKFDINQTLELLENTNKVAHIGIFQFDVNTKKIYWNNVLKSIYEVSEDFIPTLDNIFNFIKDPKQKELFCNIHANALKLKKSFVLEHDIRTAKRNNKYLQVSGQPVFEKDNCIKILGTIIDLTESKKSKLSLTKTNQQLKTAEILAKLGSWNWDLITNELKWSDNLYTIFNHNKNTPVTYEVYLDYIYKEDKEHVTKKFEDAIAHKKYNNSTYRIQLKNGAIKTLKSAGKVITNSKGEILNIVGSCQDITQELAEKKELLQKNKQLQQTENITAVGCYKLILENEEFSWTNNMYKIFDIEHGTKTNLELLFNLIHPEDRDYIKSKLDEIKEEKKSITFTHRIIVKDATVKTVKIVSDTITNSKGKVVEIYGTCQDITDKLNSKIKLHQTNKQLNLTEKVAKAGSWQWNIEKDEFKWTNNLYKILGIKVGTKISFELINANTHPEDREPVKKAIQKILETNKASTFTHRILQKNGTYTTLEVIAEPITNKKGKAVELIGSIRDITNNLSIEQELLEANELLHFAEQLTNMGFWRYKPNTNAVFWSENLYKMFEHPKEEKLSFESYFNCIHPEDQEFVKEKINQSINDNKFYDFMHRIIVNCGEIRILQITGKISINKYDGVLELLGTCLDITESETINIELTQKNQQLRIAEKMTRIGNWQWNPKTNTVIWSDNMYNIYEHDKNEPVKYETYISYVYEEDKSTVISNLKAGMQDGNFRNATYRIQLKNGKIKTLKTVGKIITNKDGDVIEMLGTCQDVTERIQKEIELTQKNQQFNFAEKIADLGSWQWDIIKNEIIWSDNHYRIFGIEIGTPINLDLFYSYIHPEDFDYVKKNEAQILTEKEFSKTRYRILLDNGQVKTLEVIGYASTNGEGDITNLIGTTQDITTRIQAKQELLEKNQLLAVAENISEMGSWEWDPITKEFTWSDNLYEIIGFEKGSRITFKKYLSRIPEEEHEIIYKHAQLSVANKNFQKFSHTIICPDNSQRTLEISSKLVTNNNGDITKIIGATRDVTEKRNKENELIEKNRLLTFVEQLTLIGYWRLKVPSAEFIWSDNLYRIFDIKVGTPMNFNKFLTHLPLKDKKYLKEQRDKFVETKVFEKFVHHLKHKNGDIKTIEVVGTVITNKDGKVTELIGSSQDITENVKKEKELIKKNQQLNKAEHLAMIGSFIYNPIIDEFKWSKNSYRIYDFEIGIPMNFDKFLTRIHPDDFENLVNHLNEIMTNKIFKKITYKIILKNGTIRTIEAIGNVKKNKSGKVIEVIGTSRDITEQMRVQEKIIETNNNLEKSTAELTARNKQLAEFNHITSHNLRAPVSNLNALLDLWKGEGNENLKEVLFDKFEIVINHLTVTLNSLIESLKVTNNMDVTMQKLSFKETLNKTEEILAAEILKTKTVIKNNFSNKDTITYNQIYLESIFLNLIGNAIKYKSPDRNPEIEIKSDTVNGKIKLSIKDNGLGIDLKRHGHKLFGLNKVFHRHPEANGIGLFMTKTQIEAMGGSIYAESEVNVGTTFFITFN